MRDLNTSGTTRGTLVSIQIRVLLIAGIVAMIGYLATWLPFLMWKLNSWTRKVGSNGPYGVHSVALSPDGRTLAATSLDTLQIWDVPSGELRATIRGDQYGLDYGTGRSLLFSPNGTLLAAAAWTALLRDTTSGQVRRTLTRTASKERPFESCTLAFSPNGKLVVTGGEGGTVRLWDTESGRCTTELQGHQGWVNAVVFSPDGTILAVESEDYVMPWTGQKEKPRQVRLWSVDSGRLIAVLKDQKGGVLSPAFSPDGERLATGSGMLTHLEQGQWGGQGKIQLWNARTGQRLATLPELPDPVTHVVFSPDGTTVAASDAVVRLWDLENRREKATLPGATPPLAFSPDGTLLATAEEGNAVRLWDARSGQQKGSLRAHWEPVNHLAFSRDGKILATGAGDERVKIWDMVTGSVLHTLRVSNSVSDAVGY